MTKPRAYYILGALFFLLWLSLIAVAYLQGRVSVQQSTSSVQELSLLEYVNQTRLERAVAPLTHDPTLDNTAKIKAEDLAALNYSEHDRPDGEKFYVNIYNNRPGSHGHKLGENLAGGLSSSQSTVQAWEDSPAHLKAMTDPAFTKFGSHTIWDEDRFMYITVAHFGD